MYVHNTVLPNSPGLLAAVAHLISDEKLWGADAPAAGPTIIVEFWLPGLAEYLSTE